MPTPRWLLAGLLAATCTVPALAGDDPQTLWNVPHPSASFTTTEQSIVFDEPFPRDLEVADDFEVHGDITRLVMGGRGCGSCAVPVVEGAWVRFYEWTADGPGALQHEVFVAAGDGMSWDGPGPYTVWIDLPAPFTASGWHFAAVQVAFGETGGFWNLVEGHYADPINATVQARDNQAGGAWGDDPGLPADVVMELIGHPTPATPVVTSVDRTTVTGSDRIVVNGSSFGTASDGTLLVDGVAAIVTAWSSTEIVAYVPEGTSTGEVELVVVNGGEPGAPVALTVEPRTPNGRIAWVFEGDGPYAGYPPVVAPDGTVYVDDVSGRLYALSADGALLWITDALLGQAGGGAEGPIALLPDGRIVVATNPLGPALELVAFEPDGSHAWTVTIADAGLSWQAGPSLGPDGRIYAAMNGSNIEGGSFDVLCVTGAGSIAWTTAAAPFVFEDASPGQRIAFGPSSPGGPVDQMAIVADRNGDGRVWGFDLADGRQRFATPIAGGNDVGQTQLVADASTGALHMLEFAIGGGGWGLQAFDAAGDRTWTFDPGIASGATRPTIDGNGTVYFGWDLSRVSAVSPDGDERWRISETGLAFGSPWPVPDQARLVMTAWRFADDQALAQVRSAKDGTLDWSQPLLDDDGDRVATGAAPGLAPDGSAAYVAPLELPITPDSTFRVFRLDLDAPGPRTDVNDDGVVGFGDLLAVLAAFGPCPGCPEDVDEDGVVGFDDVLLVLADWT